MKISLIKIIEKLSTNLRTILKFEIAPKFETALRKIKISVNRWQRTENSVNYD